jgi:hypothetical protein
MSPRLILPACLSLASLILAACGNPDATRSPSSGEPRGGDEVAEGGIGGSGSGTASGYGSIWVGGNRHFPIAEDAIVRLDGRPVAANSVNAEGQGLPLGITLEYLLAEDASDDLMQGTAIAIDAWHQVIGPVTSVAPLTVLGQPVFTTADTLLSVPGDDPALLQPGDLVAVAGMPNSFGSVRATRLSLLGDAPLDWQIVGRISDLDASGFRIRNQRISLDGIALENCHAGLSNGSKVVIQASASTTFLSDELLQTAHRLICQPEGLGLFSSKASVPAQIPAAFDGVITDIQLLPLTISLDGQLVHLEGLLATGVNTLRDLALGARVEVDGVLDTANGVITATRLSSRDPLVRIEAPIDHILGDVISVLGQTALIIPGAANTGNFSDGARISISAFTDSLGQLFVTSAQIDNSAAKQDILLHGEISAVNSVSGTFSVAGIPFNAASADSLQIKTVDAVITLIEAGLCLAQSDLPLFPCANTDTTEFLNGLAPGSYVEISNAWYDGALLQGGEVLLR